MLQNNSTAIRKRIADKGREGANEIRQEWKGILDGVLVPGQEEQRAELCRRTMQQITDWEVKLIPHYLVQSKKWLEMTDESEAEAARAERAELAVSHSTPTYEERPT